MRFRGILGIDELLSSFRILYAKPQRLFFIVLYDLLFLFSFGFIVQGFLNKMLEYIMAMASFMSQRSGTITRSYLQDTSIFALIRSNPELGSLFYSFLLTVILAIASLYIIYILFEGLSWRESRLRKMPLAEFLWKFSIVTIPWFIIFIAINIVSFVTFYLATVSERAGVFFPSQAYNAFLNALTILLLYFAIVSYGLIGSQKPFRTIVSAIKAGIMGVFVLAPKSLPIILLFLIIGIILNGIATLSNAAMLAAGIIIVMPAIALAKVYINMVVEKEGGQPA